jgi:CHAP domain
LSYRSDVVRAAVKEWQSHPEGRPALYWQEDLVGSGFSGDWCGGFALWCLKQAGLAKGIPWIIGVGFIEPQRLPEVATPEPGDIVVIPDPFEHQAIVVSYEPSTGMVTSIDGNQPGIETKVRFRSSNMQFYSIQPFIDEAERNASSWPYLVAGAAIVGAAAWAWLNPGPVDRALKRLGI